jgi:hypothetical protein
VKAGDSYFTAAPKDVVISHRHLPLVRGKVVVALRCRACSESAAPAA